MKWFKIYKDESKKLLKGRNYWDWKEDLSIESKQQCVYCAINISIFGGIRNFHVEHYKPKSIQRFKHLEHAYINLFFACSICNCFKGDDWPNDPSPDLHVSSYPDPSEIDYSTFLYQNDKYVIESDSMAGRYIINKLYLNRPQLILERKSSHLLDVLQAELDTMKNLLILNKARKDNDPLVDSLVEIIETTILLINQKYISPYKQNQISR